MKNRLSVKNSEQAHRNLNTTLYAYVERKNKEHADSIGKKLFGSTSGYVNALIARDRGVTPKLGVRKPQVSNA